MVPCVPSIGQRVGMGVRISIPLIVAMTVGVDIVIGSGESARASTNIWVVCVGVAMLVEMAIGSFAPCGSASVCHAMVQTMRMGMIVLMAGHSSGSSGSPGIATLAIMLVRMKMPMAASFALTCTLCASPALIVAMIIASFIIVSDRSLALRSLVCGRSRFAFR